MSCNSLENDSDFVDCLLASAILANSAVSTQNKIEVTNNSSHGANMKKAHADAIALRDFRDEVRDGVQTRVAPRKQLQTGRRERAEPIWALRLVSDHRTDSDIQKAYGDHSTAQANARPPYQSGRERYEGQPVWSLRNVNDHRTDSEVQKAYGDHSTKQANGRPPYQSARERFEGEIEKAARNVINVMDGNGKEPEKVSQPEKVSVQGTHTSFYRARDNAILAAMAERTYPACGAVNTGYCNPN